MQPVVMSQGDLQVTVDIAPLGGYRGPAGAVCISRKDKSSITAWSETDYLDLGQLIQKMVRVYEQNKINNILIYAECRRKNGAWDGDFAIHVVPYPKCNLWEKVMGLFHACFGAPALPEAQINKTAEFYRSLSQTLFTLPFASAVPPPGPNSKPDAFCRKAVITNQLISRLNIDSSGKLSEATEALSTKGDVISRSEKASIVIAYDNRPKGASALDNHFLVIPLGEDGHVDGSQIPSEMQFKAFEIASNILKQCLTISPTAEGALLIERIGSGLRGVQHFHLNVVEIGAFPKTWVEKARTCIRIAWASISPFAAIPTAALLERINNCRKAINGQIFGLATS